MRMFLAVLVLAQVLVAASPPSFSENPFSSESNFKKSVRHALGQDTALTNLRLHLKASILHQIDTPDPKTRKVLEQFKTLGAQENFREASKLLHQHPEIDQELNRQARLMESFKSLDYYFNLPETTFFYGPKKNDTLDRFFADSDDELAKADSEKRFVYVMPGGAVAGVMPKKPSRTNRTEIKFRFKVPFDSHEQFISYITEAGNFFGLLQFSVSNEDKDYERIHVRKVPVEKARSLITAELRELLDQARDSYRYAKMRKTLKREDAVVLSRDEYARLLGLAASLNQGQQFRALVHKYRTELK